MEEGRRRMEDPRQDLRTTFRAATESSGLAGFGLASACMLGAYRLESSGCADSGSWQRMAASRAGCTKKGADAGLRPVAGAGARAGAMAVTSRWPGAVAGAGTRAGAATVTRRGPGAVAGAGTRAGAIAVAT